MYALLQEVPRWFRKLVKEVPYSLRQVCSEESKLNVLLFQFLKNVSHLPKLPEVHLAQRRAFISLLSCEVFGNKV